MPINYNFQIAPVGQFARRDPVAEGGAIAGIGQALAGATDQIRQAQEERMALIDEREVRQSLTRFQEIQSERAELNEPKIYRSGEELEGTDFRGAKFERGADGSEIPKEIPAWQANPYINKRDALEDLENAASGIANNRSRQKFLHDGRRMIERNFQKEIEDSIEEGRLHARWEVSQDIARLLHQGEHETALDILAESEIFTEKEKAEQSNQIEKDSEFFDAKEILVTPYWGPEEFARAENMIQYLGDDKYGGPLDQDERIGLINALKRKMAENKTGASTAATAAQVRFEMFLLRQIKSEIPETYVEERELWRYHLDGDLTLAQYKSLTREIINRDIDVETKNITLAQYAQALRDGNKPPPTPENRALTNDLYQKELGRYLYSLGPDGEPDFNEIVNVGLSVSRMSGMVPQEITQQWAAAETGDAEQLQTAAMLYNQYQDTVPEAMARVSDSDFPTVAGVAARLALGVPPSVAIEGAIAARDADPVKKQALKDQWKRYTTGGARGGRSKLNESLRDFLKTDEAYKGKIWGMFGGREDTPEFLAPNEDGIQPDAEAMYQHLVESYFYAEGNLGTAELRAQRDFKKIYSLTDVNNPGTWGGKQLIAHFPAQTEFDTEQIRKSVEFQFRDLAPEGSKLFIYSDADTLRTGQRDPLRAVLKVAAIGADDTPTFLGTWTFDKERAQAATAIQAFRNRLSVLKEAERNQMNRLAYQQAGSGENTREAIKRIRDEQRHIKERISDYERRFPTDQPRRNPGGSRPRITTGDGAAD